jgi:hypothetical protein
VIRVSIEPRHLAAERDGELEIRFTNAGAGTCTDIVFKLGLPGDFLLLQGTSRVEIPQLRAGAIWTHNVTVLAGKAGEFAVTSANFSYRNEYGTPVRVSDFRAELTVLSAASAPDAAMQTLDLALASGELAWGEWDILRIRVRNASQAPLHSLALAIGGPVRIAPPGPLIQFPALAAGQQHEVSFVACPTETGNHVPAQVRVTYTEGSGRTRFQDDIIPLVVTSQPQRTGRPAERTAAPRRDTILYLAASPTDLPPLRSDKEMREIREELQLGKDRDRFRLESAAAARLKDIGQALADYDPRIVHFSGHGERDGSLYVEDELGYSVPAAPQGIADLFELHKSTVDCVIVNACHSLVLAEAINKHIGYVIAMRCEIGDAAAITFSIGFYQGLAAGAPVPQAFKRGRAFLHAQAVGKPEHDSPILLNPGGALQT